MRAPDFWWRERAGFTARILAPAGAVYGALTAARMARPGETVAAPVICVGNLVAGGAGKTPTAIALARLLQASGYRPAFLSRGYGRKRPPGSDDPLRVDPDRHGAEQTGDEPLLLARVAPTFVSSDRSAAARAAIASGADILVLDDGLQNPALHKNFSVAVADGTAGSGNGLCLPAGPLRAPAGRQWPFVSLVCVIGDGAAGRRLATEASRAGVPVVHARVQPEPTAIARLRPRRLLAFAGIGRPQKFFATLRAEGLDVVAERVFGDHHAFGARDLERLVREGERMGATLVTTSKDRVRLPRDFPVETVSVDLVFEDPAGLETRLAEAIRKAGAAYPAEGGSSPMRFSLASGLA